MASLRDLMKVAGRSRATCIKEIEAGNMPGYRISGSNNYHIPDDALDLYRHGYWVPRSQRPVQPTPFLYRRVEDIPTTPSE